MRKCTGVILAMAVGAWCASETRATAQFVVPQSYASPQGYQYSYWYDPPSYRSFDRYQLQPGNDYTRNGLPPDYIPQRRSSLYPAVPFPRNPNYYQYQTPNQWGDARDARESTYTFKVTVPRTDATLLIGGVETTQKGIERAFVSPPLVANKRYTYTIEVIWADSDGKRKDQQTTFEFSAGDPATHLVFPLNGK